MAPDTEVPGYAYIEHTADLQLKGWGPSRNEAVRQVLLALIALMAPPGSVRPSGQLSVSLTAPDVVGAMVQAANELLYRFDAEGFVPLDATVCLESSDPTGPTDSNGQPDAPGLPYSAADTDGAVCLSLRLQGWVVADGSYRPPGTLPKAATYHEASVRRNADSGRWEAQLILDL